LNGVHEGVIKNVVGGEVDNLLGGFRVDAREAL